ncbi:PREDICTED: uncharacterized protein LOC109114723 [Nelumbo nucifera]|uniref:Uncharacterized protein LOC109114723 n=1 Tax=Nelumbo nucifera TaxID=4432 RepID=A0A1U8Q5M4_NELNU|nr:PREDICTED: uncharacterized protein LOC109114723 [Nelumbo nucifera]
MITDESIIAGCTTAERKTSVRELEHEAENPSKRPWIEEPIYFTENDARRIYNPHNDALVVKLVINDFEVKRILVDSEVPWIFFFCKLLNMDEVVKPLGRITVPIAARMWSNLARFEHTFLVVATPSPYNAILGQPIRHALRAVVSTYYLAMKFQTDCGVGVIRGDQLESRKCYVAALKGKAKLADNVELEPPPEQIEE